MSKTLKAYQVSDGDERAVVVFATNNATARREGGGEFGLSFEEVESCRRAQHFDQYAPGPVPQLAMIDAGWWIECFGCSERIDSDMLAFDGNRFDDEGNDLSIEDFEPIERGRNLYCCLRCMGRSDAMVRERAAADAAVIEMLSERWPNIIKFRHVYSGEMHGAHWNAAEWQATFDLPGLKHSVTWNAKSRNTLLVARADVDEFTKLYGVKDSETSQTSPG